MLLGLRMRFKNNRISCRTMLLMHLAKTGGVVPAIKFCIFNNLVCSMFHLSPIENNILNTSLPPEVFIVLENSFHTISIYKICPH